MFSSKLLGLLLGLLLATSAGAAGIMVLAKAVRPPWVLPGAVGQINMEAPTAAQNYENAIWTKTNVADTTFATKTIAPDGTNTGEKFLSNATNGVHDIVYTNTVASIVKIAAAQPYIFTIFAKPAEYTRISIQILQTAGTSGVYDTCDLAGVTVSGLTVYNSGWSVDATNSDAIAVGNGWVRCRLSFISSGDTTLQPQIYMDNGKGTVARSISFAGTTTAGVYLWTSNLLPKGAWNHTNLVLSTDFTKTGTSTIDMAESHTAGFQWYLGGPWPNSYAISPTSLWATGTAEIPSNLTASSSGMAIAADPSTYGNDLSTIHYTSGSSFVGNAYSIGGLRQVSMSFAVASMSAAQTSWPAFWGIGSDFLTGTNNEMIEADVMELIPSGTGTFNSSWTFHDWLINTGTHALTQNARALSPTPAYANTDGAAHVYSQLWNTTTDQGGVGYVQTYFDGIYQGNKDFVYSSGAGSNPACTPSNPNGVILHAESETFPIMLGTFHNPDAATTFQFVRLWQ